MEVCGSKFLNFEETGEYGKAMSSAGRPRVGFLIEVTMKLGRKNDGKSKVHVKNWLMSN